MSPGNPKGKIGTKQGHDLQYYHMTLSNCSRLHDFTQAFRRRLPAELRTMVYDFVLVNQMTEMNKAVSFYRYRPDAAYNNFGTSSCGRLHFVFCNTTTLDLKSMDSEVVQEIGSRFYAKFQNYTVDKPELIARFLTHDFFGLGLSLPCYRLRRVIVLIEARDVIQSNPGGLLAQFQPLLALKPDWAKDFKLHLRFHEDNYNVDDSHQRDENRRMIARVLTAIEEVVARAEDGGRKGVAIVHCKGRNTGSAMLERYPGWLVDYVLEDPRVYLLKFMQNRKRRLQGTA